MRQIFCILLSGWITACLVAPVAAAPDSERKSELLYLLKHDCGSCHGMTRKGGLGPALLPGNLHDRPDSLLVNTILNGRPGTPMPPWRSELSEQDALWLVGALRRGDGL
jgi:cytochrome c55X